MGVSSLSISLLCTVLSFVNLHFWTELSFEKLKSNGLIGDYSIRLENAGRVLELIWGSFATIALVANFALNLFILLILCLKIFQAQARDRLDRLNASSSTTPWTYFRVYSVLLLVLSVDVLWYCFIH